MKISLEQWRFDLHKPEVKDFTAKDLWARDYDDSAWKCVRVPYDWAVTYPFDISNSSGTGYLPGGTGWFRTHFTVSAENSGKRAFVCFGGVYKHSKVWCNGYYLGQWQNGYTPFCMDITEALKTDGGDNVIALQVSHEDIADSRWYTGSGIMRPVYIRFVGDTHLTDDGVFFTSNGDDFKIELKLENLAEKEEEVTIKAALGSWSEEKTLLCRSSDCTSFCLKGSLPGAKKWSPEEPNLYELKVQVLSSGVETECDVRKVGFRDIRFDADKGFFCNGKSYKFKGVCVHEDAGCFGNAVPEEVWARRLAELAGCGCNAIRMSHNPHSDVLYNLCDSMGFFVMDELYDEWANAKNKWARGHNVYPPSHQGISGDFWDCHHKDARAMVTHNRNHPSIVMWSIGNEIDYPNDPYCSPKFKEMTGNNDASKPAAERQFNPNHPDISQISGLAKILSRDVKCYDTTRPVTMAVAFPELSESTGVFDHLDVVGYNYKEQFYEQDHKAHPDKPFTGSENSHSLEAWLAVKNNEYISGQFLWTGVDYLGEAKGWPVHGSPAGLLDMAAFPKPSYYFRRSLWASDVKFAKIFTAIHEPDRWDRKWNDGWNYAPGTKVDVRVFTSQDKLSLALDGNVLETRQKDAKTGFIEFTVEFKSGTLSVSDDVVTDSVSTTGPACSLLADVVKGKEISQVIVQVADAERNRVCTDESMIYASVEGDAELCGIENGDLADVTEYSAAYRHANNGRLVVYLRHTAKSGKYSLTLKSFGKPDTLVECDY